MIWKSIFSITLVAAASFQSNVLKTTRETPESVFSENCTDKSGIDIPTKYFHAAFMFDSCSAETFNVQETDFTYDNSSSKRQIFSQLVYYKGRKWIDCVSSYMDVLLTCMQDEIRMDLDQFVAAANETLDFICAKDGKIMASFLKAKGFKCLINKWDNLGNCLESDPKPPTASLFIRKNNFCHFIDRWLSCAVTEMKECSSSESGAILKTGIHKLSEYCKIENQQGEINNPCELTTGSTIIEPADEDISTAELDDEYDKYIQLLLGST